MICQLKSEGQCKRQSEREIDLESEHNIYKALVIGQRMQRSGRKEYFFMAKATHEKGRRRREKE